MKKLSFPLLVCIILLYGSCKKDPTPPLIQRDDQGVITYLPPLWNTAMTESIDDLNFTIVRKGVVYDGGVIVPKDSKRKPSLVMLSAKDGSVLWEWNDLFDLDADFLVLDSYHQYEGNLVFINSRRIYGIDLKTGKTIIKKKTEDAFNNLRGFGDQYFISSVVEFEQAGNTRYRGSIFTGTFDEGNYDLVLTPPYTNTGGSDLVGLVSPVEAYVAANGDEMLSFYYDDEGVSHRTIYRALYNHTADSIVYSGIVSIPETAFSANAQHLVYEDLGISGVSKMLFAYDVASGDLLWSKEFAQTFTFSGYIVSDGILIANNEDTYLYGIEPYSGELLWKEKSSGTSSTMAALNGVVYFVGGGDGLLHAVDIATGKHLWKLRSPDLEKNPGAFFMPRVSIVPEVGGREKGVIVVSSYLGAMAFEAVR